MQLLRDNYTLWEVDLQAIKTKMKEAGHYVEGEDGEEEDDDADQGVPNNVQEVVQKKQPQKG